MTLLAERINRVLAQRKTDGRCDIADVMAAMVVNTASPDMKRTFLRIAEQRG